MHPKLLELKEAIWTYREKIEYFDELRSFLPIEHKYVDNAQGKVVDAVWEIECIIMDINKLME